MPPDPSVVTAGSTYTFSFYGPVTGAGVIETATSNMITNMNPEVVAQLNMIGPGVSVTGPGIIKGRKLLKVDVADNSVELTQAAAPAPEPVSFTFS
jgi:hypothetical protein